MKKNLILFILFLTYCIALSSQTQSYKRGLCVDNGKLQLQDLQQFNPGVSWFYNWGTSTSTQYSESEVLYVPMTWNGGYNASDLRNFLQNHPDVKYLLAFNEPNFRDQANMTPTQAAAAWPALEAIADEFGLKIVSPAPNWCGNCVTENGVTYYDPYKYLEDFFQACPDCRVDYIGIHFYMGDLNALKGSLEKLYNDFGKPIWLTEFNMDKNGMGDNGTADEQRAFMVSVLDYLEQAGYIYRYSWFLARGGIVADLLAPAYGQLSDLGKIYTYMSSYDDTFFHQVNDTIEAEHYINMENISLVLSTDVSGNISVGYVGTGSMLEYNIDVPYEGKYDLNMRVTSDKASVVEIYSGNDKVHEINLPATGGWANWQTITNQIQLKQGRQKLKFIFRSGGSDINWLSVTEYNPFSQIDQAKKEKRIKIYPNPVQEKLSIESSVSPDTGIVYNLYGEMMFATKLDADLTMDLGKLSSGLYILRLFSCGEYIDSEVFSKN